MSLAVSGYVKQFYKGNIFGATEDGRKGHDIRSLVSADMQATRRALRDLHDYDYSVKEDEGEELYRKVQAYVNTYNNYIDSAHELNHDDVERSLSKLKKMAKERQDDFSVIGIKVQNNGKLKVDKDTLEKAGKTKISRVFSGDSDYEMQVEKHMKKIQTLIRRNNLGMPVQASKKTEKDTAESEDAILAQKLAEALDGRQINQTI